MHSAERTWSCSAHGATQPRPVGLLGVCQSETRKKYEKSFNLFYSFPWLRRYFSVISRFRQPLGSIQHQSLDDCRIHPCYNRVQRVTWRANTKIRSMRQTPCFRRDYCCWSSTFQKNKSSASSGYSVLQHQSVRWCSIRWRDR